MKNLSGTANTNGATIITIPAGQRWKGEVALSGGTTVLGSCAITVQGGGAGVSPPAGTKLLEVAISVVALSASNANNRIGSVVVTAGNAAATLRLDITGLSAASASANGQAVAPTT